VGSLEIKGFKLKTGFLTELPVVKPEGVQQVYEQI
jgi:hypothetical protein